MKTQETTVTPINGGFGDPNFAKNKKEPVHRWAPWVAGFSKTFVESAIDKHLHSPGTVLDPFCGVGTTLLCAIYHGHKAIGFEINPYAVLASTVKTNAHKINSKELEKEICRFEVFNEKGQVGEPKSKSPVGFKTKTEFYSPLVLKKVLFVRDFIDTIKNTEIRGLFNLALGATLVKYSNYSYEPSLGTREGAGKEKILEYDVGAAILAKLKEMLVDIREVSQSPQEGKVGNAEIVCDSFFNYEGYPSLANSVDLIITSPPYLNNYHYVRNTRPQLFWLELVSSSKELKQLETDNFGKYWQTVRQGEKIELEPALKDPEIVACIEAIRKVNPERGIYGGSGWANYVTEYLNDCYRFAKGIDYCLKSGGIAAVVIGNNVIQGVEVPTDVFLGKIAEKVGLELVKIHVPREKRIGNSIIHSTARIGKAKKKTQLYESVVELRKP